MSWQSYIVLAGLTGLRATFARLAAERLGMPAEAQQVVLMVLVVLVWNLSSAHFSSDLPTNRNLETNVNCHSQSDILHAHGLETGRNFCPWNPHLALCSILWGRELHLVTRLLLQRFQEIQIHNDLEDSYLKLMSHLLVWRLLLQLPLLQLGMPQQQ